MEPTRSLGGAPTSLLDRWVFLPNAGLSMPGEEAPVVGAVVFLYVDHECGTTAMLLSRGRSDEDLVRLYGERYLRENGALHLFRYGAFSMTDAVPLSDQQVLEFELDALAVGLMEAYKVSDHAWQREDRRLDRFRNESHPDDMLALLPREDGQAEGVWVRLEAPFVADDFEGFRGRLLNQPDDSDAFVNAGDSVVLRLVNTEDDSVLALVGKVRPT